MAEQEQGQGQRPQPVRAARTSRAWWALGAGLLVVLLAVVFMAQNSNEVRVHFLWLKGDIALGVALLLAAVLGGLAVLLLGAARVLALRRQAKRGRQGAPPK